MQKQLIECIPNISEGKDLQKIYAIAYRVLSIKGIKLLEVDPGKAANRTVITFIGEPEKVVEAAFRLIQKATELIDMRDHQGEHPRFGAVDVCPLVPIANISLEQTIKYAHLLGEKVGTKLNVPVYLYEAAAKTPERKNLANCRSGEYEGLSKKIKNPKWRPDFGPAQFSKSVARSGAVAIGARNFLVAYNVNLNTTSTELANSIAGAIRESGHFKEEGGKKVMDATGKPIRIAGKLKAVKGLGWFIKEYGIAQVSYNLTDINKTPVHLAFDETCKIATEKGLRVTGSELVGLIPLKAMLAAAYYFLEKQKMPMDIPEKEKIKIAVKSLGLDNLKPFDPNKKILEYALKDDVLPDFLSQTLTEFSLATASASIAPSGGSTAAYVGSLGMALGTMAARLSDLKLDPTYNSQMFKGLAGIFEKHRETLLKFVNMDAEAYNGLIAALRLPKNTEKEKKARKEAIEDATISATETPFFLMFHSGMALDMFLDLVKEGLPSAVSDAAVGALCAKTAITSSYFNVMINAKNIKNKKRADYFINEAEKIYKKSLHLEKELMKLMASEVN